MRVSKSLSAKKQKKITKPKPPPRRAGTGRPTLYHKDYCEEVRKLALLGMTDEHMIEVLCIAPRTFYLWKQKHIEFRTAINAGKIMADAEVANALYKRATGHFTVPETKVALHKGKFVTTTIEKHFEPNANAAKFILQKRHPTLWKEKIEVNINAFPDKQTLDNLYTQIMQQANQQQARIALRAENSGLDVES